MGPAFGRDCGSRCGDGPEMTKALDAPWIRPSQKSPWCASAIEMTLILAIGYFYRFLPILTEFSVREQRLAELPQVAGGRRARGPYAHGGRHRCCAEHGDPGRPKHPRCLGQAAARCHEVIDQNRRTG
jgi:hypothetical protein